MKKRRKKNEVRTSTAFLGIAGGIAGVDSLCLAGDEKMTIEEAKRELKQIEAYKQRIIDRRRRLAELRQSIGGIHMIAYGETHVAATKADNCRLENAIDRIAALEDKIAADIVALAEAQDALTGKIEQLPHPYSTVLARRYVHSERFEKIAVEMNYSYYYITRKLFPKALKKYADL